MKIKFTYNLIVVYVKDSHITCFEPTNDFMFLVEYLNAGNLFIKTSELVNLLKEESFIGAQNLPDSDAAISRDSYNLPGYLVVLHINDVVVMTSN